MKIGLNFLPTVGPSEVPADQYYAECLELCETADGLGFSHVKVVEHYFYEWGGYSPDPITFLTAVAARTTRVRLVTGAAVPAFTHPIKLAASLAMLDNISGGRLDAGFGRAFLPTEFEAFGVSMSESRPRMQEGVTAIHRLWTSERFRWDGTFHKFGPLPALLPQPRQRPAPPIFIAATGAAESFEWAGANGYNLMVIPIVASHEKLAGLLKMYEQARRDNGHSEDYRIHVSYHGYIGNDRIEARERAEQHFEDYKRKQLDAYGSWRGVTSSQYPGYEKMEEAVRNTTFDDLRAAGNVIVGDVGEVVDALQLVAERYPRAEASLHLRFGDVTQEEAMRSVRLLGTEVVPKLAAVGRQVGE
jgi:alkanesulfonate monooxygenase SsuD/methylene tetrahydromethanopterin reductase-like flavin-dependent oxidoreductase (luciferase family)